MTFKIKLIDIKIDNTFCLKLNYSITQANCQSAEEACLWLASLRYKKKITQPTRKQKSKRDFYFTRGFIEWRSICQKKLKLQVAVIKCKKYGKGKSQT